jgi:hypothetical protein
VLTLDELIGLAWTAEGCEEKAAAGSDVDDPAL